VLAGEVGENQVLSGMLMKGMLQAIGAEREV
jgi:hypothetical protein